MGMCAIRHQHVLTILQFAVHVRMYFQKVAAIFTLNDVFLLRAILSENGHDFAQYCQKVAQQ